VTYRCGIGPGMEKFGLVPGPPRFTCDGCGLVVTLRTDRPSPAWLFDRRAPPGWERIEEEHRATHLCRLCRKATRYRGAFRDLAAALFYVCKAIGPPSPHPPWSGCLARCKSHNCATAWWSWYDAARAEVEA
jgi:hypothetical protein